MNNVVHKANGYSCPYCKSININKNGKKNGKQRYICKECGKYFTPISKSMFIKTHHKYINWLNFIHCELLDLSLEEESYECDIAKLQPFIGDINYILLLLLVLNLYYLVSFNMTQLIYQ